MLLYVDTTQNNLIAIGIKDKNKFIAKKEFASNHAQAEKLLPGIEKLLKAKGLKLHDLRGIRVANQGGSFTSLRIGVVTANALAYALGIPVRGESGRTKTARAGKESLKIVEPLYGGEPRITKKKKLFNIQ
ncbi:MAG: tRNA (adenosine(37)-N6)-threonylcarbamoyltransferase complex dimerization subunit type 1 TsaB [Patescibacteria group bacterium]|nr:tRNA (adenosine(37)-N6)-threonylcarbamoyltransferase complex dimerization subunit type 1 TsaB [Patescibacteria group bacterium]